MSNSIGVFLKKTILRKSGNLVSLEDPFDVMPRLLQGRSVTGILDAGAGYGRISRKLIRRFPQAHVFAFEPNELYAGTLRQFAEAEPRFHPYSAALSDETGRAFLNVTSSPGSTSLLTPGGRMRDSFHQEVSVEDRREVGVTTIDDWVRSNGTPSLELLKFDIQGAELKALRGATCALRDSVLLVYSEVWFNPGYEAGALFSEIDSFLRSCGFVLYDFYKPKHDRRGVIIWGNAIFVHASRLGM